MGFYQPPPKKNYDEFVIIVLCIALAFNLANVMYVVRNILATYRG